MGFQLFHVGSVFVGEDNRAMPCSKSSAVTDDIVIFCDVCFIYLRQPVSLSVRKEPLMLNLIQRLL